jgi:riboflavin kinase
MAKLEKIFHLPDLQFVQFCEKRFALNKGIYNTIDSWFYDSGVYNIVERRKLIFQFSMQHCAQKTKFGPGGLTRKLEAFVDQADVLFEVH